MKAKCNLKKLLGFPRGSVSSQKKHFGTPFSPGMWLTTTHPPICSNRWAMFDFAISCGWRLLLDCYVCTRVKSESLFDRVDSLELNAATNSLEGVNSDVAHSCDVCDTFQSRSLPKHNVSDCGWYHPPTHPTSTFVLFPLSLRKWLATEKRKIQNKHPNHSTTDLF